MPAGGRTASQNGSCYQSVYISMKQSEKNKWWGLGVVKTCTVKLRVGASERIAKTFTANFTCH
jgi:hypothetical protein